MAKTIEELRAQSQTVKYASTVGENTATRVGALFDDIVGHVQEFESAQSASDEDLSNRINSEANRAKGAEEALQRNIELEAEARANAIKEEENARNQAIEVETLRAKQVEDSLRQGLHNEVERATGAEGSLSNRIAEEASRAKGVESTLQSSISTEVLRATQAEQGLSNKIAAELERAKTAEEALDNAIKAEAEARGNADEELKTKIEAEVERATAAEEANATSIIGTDRIAEGAVTYDKLQEEIKEVAEGMTYVESPEFIYYHCDADNRLLWWIYKDGTVDWAKGVPQPVQEELKKLEQLINDNLTGDEQLKGRVAANEAAIVAINETLDKKVDGVYQDSVEYIKTETDSEDRILNAIRTDGTNFMPSADVEMLALNGGGVDNDAVLSNSYTDSPEYINVTEDADGRIIEALKPDGTKYIHNVETERTETRELSLEGSVIDNDAVKSTSYDENPEFINVEKDADGRILSATKPDGSHYIHNAESETIPTEFSSIEDIEDRIEIKQDADSRILSYRDSDGKLHENAGLETTTIDAQALNVDKIEAGSLNLSQVGLTEFEQALRANGFRGGQGDWSEATSLQIPEPRCAMMNITSADGTPYSWPTSKFANKKIWAEFYDMQGNYFKKRAIHNAQGSSSMGFVKKNGAFDLCNDEWIGDDTFSVKFGDWVYQDSFHAKAYYTDFFKGVSIIAYKIADQVEKSRGIFEDRPWKKALLKDYTIGTDQTNSAQIDDLTLQLNNEAKCHPDGFPCIIYLDGKFYGIYAFNLKKHRDNMHQTKDVAEHIHLDGTIHSGNFFNGTISWGDFEIRNPKNLYYKEAQNNTFEYDADVAQAEIAGDEEVNAWIEAGQLPDGTTITSKIEKRLRMTAKVKKYIIGLSQAVPQILAASTTLEKKTLFETYLDVNNLVDYEIVQMATGDTDGFGKNWQWTTYDGIKWWVNEYDKDMSFGGYFTGMFTQPAPTTGGWMGYDTNQPIGLLISLYKTELKERWKYMVEKGIFTTENFLNLFNDWLDRIGTDNFEKEYQKWTEAPCNREDNVDTVHWQRTNIIDYDSSLANYDNQRTYTVGEKCWFDLKSGWSGQFVCIAETTGNPPVKELYPNYPQSLGYRDSIWRLANYIRQRLEKENEFINTL